jgi:transcriptional regulator with XRE-family HTH domain
MVEKLYEKAFAELGKRYRKIRHDRNMVQEDVLEYGFSVRHFQQIESGRPHSLTTLFRLAEMLKVDPSDLLQGLRLPSRNVAEAVLRQRKLQRAKRRLRSRS